MDLGLNPFTAAYTSGGQPYLFSLTNADHLTALERVHLSPEAQHLLHHLMYASGRIDSKQLWGD